ncbi:ChaC-domain-containing protein [Xylariomycetidae sp. FL2044]|nr:ChaC-domain-containing protein [Xylariomycetidae sp. FL2044]
MTEIDSPTPGEFWIFGYGSLIWKPPPYYDRRIPGWVTGYVRRFWQVYHRGTPEAPGRVVTLIERAFWSSLRDAHDTAPDEVWGVAYRIEASRVAEVREYLDIREINGYTIHYTPFHPSLSSSSPSSSSEDDNNEEEKKEKKSKTIRTLVYIGTPDNDQFVGPQDPQRLAEHIYASRGPSGPNSDYLLELGRALDELSPGRSGDGHVADLCARLRGIERSEREGTLAAAEGSGEDGGGGGGQQAGRDREGRGSCGSVEEQEEIEKVV